MSEFKHTPGAWVQATRGPNGCPIIGTENGLMVAMLAHSSNENTQRQEAEANARLIAAAPELLEVLKELYESVDSCIDLTPEAMKKARAAIAKATGVKE